MTREQFAIKTRHWPIQDDLVRANCKKAGRIGHEHCGWCKTHDCPQFMCSCFIIGKYGNPEQLKPVDWRPNV